jgi:hypothetical protein
MEYSLLKAFCPVAKKAKYRFDIMKKAREEVMHCSFSRLVVPCVFLEIARLIPMLSNDIGRGLYFRVSASFRQRLLSRPSLFGTERSISVSYRLFFNS